MNLKTITVAFGASKVAKLKPRFKYDYGQVLKFIDVDLPEAYEVHFSNTDDAGTAKRSIGDEEGALIPDEYFAGGDTIYAWLFLSDTEAGRTVRKVVQPLIPRPEADSTEPTPVQQDAITQAINALNAAVTETGENVTLAAGYADEAEGYKDDADGFAEDAEAWAVGQRDGQDVPADDETYHNNSKFYADVAEQAVAESGWIQFHIDENGHLIYTKTDNVDLVFSLVNGHLIVEG